MGLCAGGRLERFGWPCYDSCNLGVTMAAMHSLPRAASRFRRERQHIFAADEDAPADLERRDPLPLHQISNGLPGNAAEAGGFGLRYPFISVLLEIT